MKPKDIYFKTMKFVWLKLAVKVAVLLFSILLFALILWIGSLISGDSMVILGLLWLGVSLGVYGFVQRYFGYMIKAAHVAVITEAVTSGRIPENQFQWGKDKVKRRFGTVNVYFVIDRLVSGAVSQLQRVVGKVGDLLSSIPGMNFITNIIQLFISVAFGSIDECCLGWVFYKTDNGAFQSSCDGVCLYFQNIKKLLKDAVKTTLIIIIALVIAWVIPFVICLAIVKALELGGIGTFFAIIVALFIASAIKSAFIDSYMLIAMMTSYMKEAPNTEIRFDLYGKLCKMSSKFKKLFTKAQAEVAPHSVNSYSTV